ncbi:MAG: ABC transporter ATP-binding protein, partial [Anaerolineae bacterium]|nr:ABC transporter ATP-binding protein [Anaerolineae bacterium]
MELPLSRYWALMAQYLAPLRAKVILLAGLIFATIGLQLANPQIIRYFIDTALTTADSQPLFVAALIFLGASLLLQAISVAATYIGEDVGWQSTNQLRADLARHCLKLDMTFHNEHTPGEMIERIDGDVADIAIFFAQFVIRILGNLLLIIGILVVLTFEDWRIALALTIFTMLSIALISYLRQIAVPHWKVAREASADLFGFLEEHLAGTEDTRSSGAVPYVMRNLFKFNKFRYDAELKGATMTIMLVVTWIGLISVGQIIALVASYLLYRQGALTVGTVYLIIFYTSLIFRPLREITAQIQNLQKAAAGIERVESLYQVQSKIKD